MLIKKYDQGGYATVGRAISKPPVKKWVYGGRKPLTWFLDEGNGKRTVLGQVYIPNKGTVALTANGRAFTDDNGSWKPIHLTNYDKFHISKAIKSGGSGVFGGYLGNWGKATQSVADAWFKNSKTWLASSRPSARVAVPKPATDSPASAREQAKDQKAVVDKTGTQPRINNTAEGKRIMDWQRKLGVKADGWWGKNTASAYAKYQKQQQYTDNVRSSVQSPSLPASMAQQNAPTLEELGLDSNSQQKYRKGGMLVNKYQQGGTTSDPMDQLAQVAAKFLQGDTQSGQQLAQVFSDQKVGKQLMQAVQQGVQQKDKRAIIIAQAIQALSGSRKARLGAKLNYFHKDICPAGEKLVYFKKGGEICKACQKMDMGGEMADDKKEYKTPLVKKPQNKQQPKQTIQKKVNQKPNNKRPGPKDLKSLPNGKYPVYWTADQRGQWDRDHDEGV